MTYSLKMREITQSQHNRLEAKIQLDARQNIRYKDALEDVK